MTEANDVPQHDGVQLRNLEMYEAGMEEEGGFHVFNASDNQYHRTEALQRIGAIDITCSLDKVIHGAMSADSDCYATLIVMQWHFQPRGLRRISEATIELHFEHIPEDEDFKVAKISFDDTYSLMPTSQEESTTRGAEATMGSEHVGFLNVTTRVDKVSTFTKSDAITLSGGKRVLGNRPPYRIATWTLSENQSQPAGIPASLKVAVLLSRDDEKKFSCKLSCTCKTDWMTTFGSWFKKIPKDDPITFQPDPEDMGEYPNMNVTYGDENLGSVDLDDLSEVRFRTMI